MRSENTEDTQNKEPSIEERVRKICDDLNSQGTKPSVRLVLSKLSDVRSTSTVHKYFVRWREEVQSETKSLFDRLGLSDGFTEALMKEFARFNGENEKIYIEKAREAIEHRDVAIENLIQSDGKLKRVIAKVDSQADEIIRLKNELQALKQSSNSELASQEQIHQATICELRAQIGSERTQNNLLLEQNESLSTSKTKAESKLEMSQHHLSELKQEFKQLQEDYKYLNSVNTDLKASLAGLTAELAATKNIVDAAEVTNSKLTDENRALKTLNSKIETENEKLTHKVNELNAKHEASTNKTSELSSQVLQLTNKVDQLNIVLGEQSRVISRLSKNNESTKKQKN